VFKVLNTSCFTLLRRDTRRIRVKVKYNIQISVYYIRMMTTAPQSAFNVIVDNAVTIIGGSLEHNLKVKKPTDLLNATAESNKTKNRLNRLCWFVDPRIITIDRYAEILFIYNLIHNYNYDLVILINDGSDHLDIPTVNNITRYFKVITTKIFKEFNIDVCVDENAFVVSSNKILFITTSDLKYHFDFTLEIVRMSTIWGKLHLDAKLSDFPSIMDAIYMKYVNASVFISSISNRSKYNTVKEIWDESDAYIDQTMPSIVLIEPIFTGLKPISVHNNIKKLHSKIKRLDTSVLLDIFKDFIYPMYEILGKSINHFKDNEKIDDIIDVYYHEYEDLVDDIESETLTIKELQNIAENCINELIEPIREQFKTKHNKVSLNSMNR